MFFCFWNTILFFLNTFACRKVILDWVEVHVKYSWYVNAPSYTMLKGIKKDELKILKQLHVPRSGVNRWHFIFLCVYVWCGFSMCLSLRERDREAPCGPLGLKMQTAKACVSIWYHTIFPWIDYLMLISFFLAWLTMAIFTWKNYILMCRPFELLQRFRRHEFTEGTFHPFECTQS